MGDPNQLFFVENTRQQYQGPFLEVGSHDYGNTQNIRDLFTGEEYVGADMNPGPGVDICIDLTKDFAEINDEVKGKRFGTIFCLSVMEHVDQPFKMAENLTALLAPGGKLCLSVPFAWKFHGYPSDYWRFTHEGVKKLFPDLDFTGYDGHTSSSQLRDYHSLDNNIGQLALHAAPHRKAGHALRGLSAKLLRLLAKLGLWRWLHGYRYVMAPTMINMIGIKK
jgi:SAM-dependent methyltransferase